MHLELKMKPKIFIILTLVIGILFIGSRTNALQYTFKPRVSAGEQYTSNVFLSDDNEKDDFITIVSAGFTAKALGKTGFLELSYDPAYTKYRDFDENDAWRHDARLRGRSDLTKRTRFDIWNSFLRSEDPLSEEDILELRDKDVVQEGDTSTRKNRRTFYRNTARTRLSYQFGKDDSVYAGFLYGLLRNNDPQDEDNDRYSPSAGLNYWFGPKFGIESRAEYTRGKFDQNSGFTDDPTDDFKNYAGSIRFIARTKTRFSIFTQYNQVYRDFDNDFGDNTDYMVYAPSAGFTYVVEKGLNLRLGGGYFYQEVDGDDDEQGIFSNSQIDKTWNYRRGFINLTALTGIGQNDFGSENIGLERSAAIQGSAKYEFTRKLFGDINGRYRYSDVIGNADQGADDNTGEKVHRYRAGAGLTFEPLKWMAIRLGYNFNKVDSEDNRDDYDEHRGLLRITLSPDKPYRYKE
jgi:hypothetical protein